MKISVESIILGLVLVFMSANANAQFSKYWNESFSTKAALLAGAVVGGYPDETSIYYNPSILSDSSVSQLSLVNGLAKFEGLKFEDALGQDQTITDLTSTVSPSFISLNMYPKDPFGLVWKAAIFNKTKFDRTVRTEYQETGDFVQPSPGNEVYVGKVNNRTEYDDLWFGVGAAKFLSPKFSMGLSLFGRYSSLSYNIAQNVQLNGEHDYGSLNQVARNGSNSYLSGYAWRATVKLGANYRVNERLRIGMVVSAPSINITGEARSERNETNVNIPNSTTGEIMPDNLYDATGEALPFTMKEPVSIALGIDFQLEKFRVNLTGEFFGAIAPYKMVDQAGGETRLNMVPETNVDNDYLSYAAGAKPVLNFAIGLEKFQNNNKSFLFGFKTDFDALKNFNYQEYDGLNTFVGAKTNYYHVSAGKNFAFLKYDVLFGVQYSFSRAKNLTAFANFNPNEIETNENSYDLQAPIENNMSFSGNTITLFVGLTLKK